MQRVIGGELEISGSAPACPLFQSDLSYQLYPSGRAALYAVLTFLIKNKNIGRILLPDYLCSSIVHTIEALGLDYIFYPLSIDLKPDMAEIGDAVRPSDTILLINYFGLMDLADVCTEIRSLCPDCILIEDDVQALSTFIYGNSSADFSFTSLRKWLPLPDGGAAKSASGESLPQFDGNNTFAQHKLGGLLLKGLKDVGIYDDSVFLDMLHKGENLIDSCLEADISHYSKSHLGACDMARLLAKRKVNSDYLLEGLKSIGIAPLLPVPDEAIPFFIPIWLNDRDSVRRRMFDRSIFCPVHWPLDGLDVTKGAQMARHELSLIIDHRYTYSDLDRIINALSV